MTQGLDEHTLRVANAHQLALKNRNCIFCGDPLTKANRTREHVIARNFVPKGTLDLNLIAWACHECNLNKSNLEDDISLISMLPAVGDPYAPDDERIAEITRKAQGAFSRRTRKPVKDSKEKLTISGQPLPGVNATFELLCNPQTDPERIHLLAMFHVQAFFYLTTFKQDTQLGARLPGIFTPIGDYRRSDWGNARARSFVEITKDWDPRLVMKGDASFFKIIIKRKLPQDLWSWAIEWNKNVRVFGFFGAQALVDEVAASLPKLKTKQLVQSDTSFIRFRTEEPLADPDDTLFVVEEQSH